MPYHDITYTAPAIAFEEISLPTKSPQEKWARQGGFSAVRTLKCAWADRLTLARQLLRAYTVVTLGRTFIVGDLYPYRSRCYVTGITGITPVGKATSGSPISWPHAYLTVQYEGRSFTPGGASGGPGVSSSSVSSNQEFFTVADFTLDVAAEFLTLPGKKLYWNDVDSTSSGALEPIEDVEAPGRLVRMMDTSVNWRESGTLPTALHTLAGYVNSDEVTSTVLGWTFPIETLLYQGISATKEIFSDGSTDVWDVTGRLTYRPDGWNKFYKSGTTAAQPIYDGSGAVFKPYPTTQFMDVLILDG